MLEYPENPSAAVAVVVFGKERILAVKRKNPPAKGKWSVPGGSINPGETIKEAAAREVLEETGVKIEVMPPYTAIDVIEKDSKDRVRFHYIIVYMTADYISGDARPGDDAEDVCWFTKDELSVADTPDGTMRLVEMACKLHKKNAYNSG